MSVLALNRLKSVLAAIIIPRIRIAETTTVPSSLALAKATPLPHT